MSPRLDLHVHTTASDGWWTPARVVQEAVARGLRAIALTDHETTAGVAEAQAAAQGTPLEVIPGVEISVGGPEEEIDLLGYFIDPDHPDLQRLLGGMRGGGGDGASRPTGLAGAMGGGGGTGAGGRAGPPPPGPGDGATWLRYR